MAEENAPSIPQPSIKKELLLKVGNGDLGGKVE
jgi:hypothetical protein